MKIARRKVSSVMMALTYAPIWWLLGLDVFVYAIIMTLGYILNPCRVRLNKTSYFIFTAILMSLLLSLFIAIVWRGEDLVRCVAALYNLALWGTGFLVLIEMNRVIKNQPLDVIKYFRVARYIFYIFSVMIIGSFLYMLFTGKETVYPTALGIIVKSGLPGILNTARAATFVKEGWSSLGMLPRSTVMAPYPTATAVSVILLAIWAYLYIVYEEKEKKKKKRFEKAILWSLCTFCLIATASRTVIVGCCVGILLSFFLRLSPVSKMITITIILLLVGPIYNLGIYVNNMRGESSATRFVNYERAIELVLKSNPVLGYGIKPRENEGHIPLGSHSTFVSGFTKGGLLVLTLIVMLFIVIPVFYFAKYYRSHSNGEYYGQMISLFLVSYVVIIFWIVSEDVDAPAMASFLIFFQMALILNVNKMVALLQLRGGVAEGV